MRDQNCVQFLQWCLPRLDLRWPGYRKVRRTVCKRVGRRWRELGLEDLAAYRAYLDDHPAEWARLDGLCRIPISRFYRDRGVFDCLAQSVLPDLAERAARRESREVRAWSAGCASGEEIYTLRLIWDFAVRPMHPAVRFRVLGTDADPGMLRRAESARYRAGSLKDLPAAWRDSAFTHEDDFEVLRPEFRRGVTLIEQDIRRSRPDGPFDLILCRNLAFTYFAPALQAEIQRAIAARLTPGGVLVIGSHERLPVDMPDLVPAADHLPLYQRS